MSCRGFRRSLLLLCSLSLASCGSGGGSEVVPPPPPPPTVTAPVITTQPASVTAPVYGTATFTVAATGNGMLSYQWYAGCPCISGFDAIPGATQPSLSFSGKALVPIEAVYYYVVVTNSLSGKTATTQSKTVQLNLLGRNAATLTGESAVLPGTAGHVVSTAAQAGTTYAWTITNGTITAGLGTNQITYTAGALGQVVITVTVPSPTGTGIAVKNVVVAASLPIVSVFGQSSVLVGTNGVLASAPATAGQSYAWTLTDGTASATITSGQTADVLTYAVGSSPGTYQAGVSLTDALGNQGSDSETLNVVENTFVSDPRDAGPRALHTATLLNDGRVLIAGGDEGVPNLPGLASIPVPVAGSLSQITSTTELFDPATNTFAFAGSLITARFEHTATRLNDGRVLVVGGGNSSTVALASSEIYDPVARAWSAGPPLATARALHTATLLSDGRVLVAGGVNANGAVGTAEIYDPVANTWSAAGSMVSARVLNSATLLSNGQVLVVGGYTSSGPPGLASAELYDPATNGWSATASLPTEVSGLGGVLLVSGQVLQLDGQGGQLYDPTTATWTAAALPATPISGGGGTSNAASPTLLPDGRVLATSGVFAGASAIYDPITQSWTSTAEPTGQLSSATSLANGQVLVVSGVQSVAVDPTQTLTSANTLLFDPVAGAWQVLSSGAHGGALAANAVLPNGTVLVSGGNVTQTDGLQTNATAATDLYTPATNAWSSTPPMTTARSSHTSTVLGDGSVLVTGGTAGCFSGCLSVAALATAERYSVTANAWTSAGAMANPRYQHTASLLANGMVLVAGGSNALIGSCNCTTFLAAAELYDPTANTWTTTGSLATARYAHTATVLPNGNVLVAGGFGGTPNTLQNVGAVLASAELYDPTTGTWSPAASMNTARSYHTATLLASGLVLVTGGSSGTATTPTAEVYDPTANTWTAVASLLTPRQSQQAVLLPTGDVLIVGGYNTSSNAVFGVGTAELYDPVADTFSAAGSMVTLRQGFTLSGLGDGRVMLVGGLPNLAGLPEFYK
jgi:N-acetylneuraminic acid mutarotase